MAKILIVEDEVLLADAYKFLLQTKGHKVTCAKDGEDGLLKLGKATPDLILLDMMMPKLDGLGLLRAYDVKKHPSLKVIVMSNMQSPEYVDEAMALGAARYEIKSSLSPPQLIEIVDQVLSI